jgi:hypothetical protein
MNTCHDYQAQLLDHLYDLLEPAQAQALEAHLDRCPDCRAAQEAAAHQRQVLTVAAKAQFPEVRFTPPVARVETPAPRTLAMPAPRSRRWGAWAAAASVLVALGLGLAGGLTWYRYSEDAAQARAEQERIAAEQNAVAQRQERARRRSQDDISGVQEQIRLLEASWTSEVQKVQREIAGNDVQITVTGPKAVQAGAPNVYQIDARRQFRAPGDRAGKLPLNARIVDASKNKVLCMHEVAEGSTRWELPRNLAVEPGARLVLVVTEEGDGPAGLARVLGSAVSPLGPTPFTAAGNYLARSLGRVRLSEALELIGTVHVSHLTTDRPMYRPGEMVHFRSLTLERFSLKPAQEDLQLRFRITDPRGTEVFSLDGPARVARDDGKDLVGPDGKPIRGIGAGEFRVPPGAAGGEYTLTLSEAQNRFPPERRKFLVNHYQAPRLTKELDFTRKSYGPGEVVEANCKVARVEGGGVIDNQPVHVSAQVDGQPCTVLDEGALRVRQGKVTVRVRLPEKIARGEASLSVQFHDGGTQETLVRPIPVVLKKLFVEFFPEGGDLVAGTSNRVYFTARTTLGKPAELRGRLVGPDGKTLTEVRTLNDDQEAGVNQGMGLFEFTPQAGTAYEVKIDSPIGIEGHYRLPGVKADGVVLKIPEGVFSKRIQAVVSSMGRERKLLIGAYCRGRLLDHKTQTVRANETVSFPPLTPTAEVSGVYRVTVFEERPGAQLVPVAERLVYRKPVERLDLQVKADRESYGPGDKARIKLTSADEKKRNLPAIIVASAVDLGIIKMADEKTARSLPTHFYLGSEVRKSEDLEYADFLVGPHPKASAALDLLLGTQGWRRFAEQRDPGQFREEQKQDADRLLMASGTAVREENNLAELRLARVDKAFAVKHVALNQKLAAREVRDDQDQKQAAGEAAQLRLRLGAAAAATQTAEDQLSVCKQRLARYGLIFLAVVLLALTALGLTTGLRRMAREQKGAGLWFATGLCSLMLLFLGSLGVAGYLLSGRPTGGFGPMAAARARQEAAVARDQAVQAAQAERRAEDRFRFADKAAPGIDEKVKLEDEFEMKMKKEVLERKRGQDNEGAPPPPRPVEAPRVPAPQPAAEPMPGPIPVGKGKGNLVLADPKLAAGRLEMPDAKAPPALIVDGLKKGEKMPEAVLMAPPGLGEQPGRGPAGGPMRGGFGGEERLRQLVEVEKALRKQGKFDDIARLRMQLDARRGRMVPTVLPPLVVREYAHTHLPSADKVRRDFTETVLWHPVLVLPGDKEIEVAFDLSDSVTRYQVQVWGHSLDGRLGAATTEIASRLPFSVEPKVPVEVTRSDKITLPVVLANESGKALSVELGTQARNLEVVGPAIHQLALDPKARVRKLFTFRPSVVEGEAVVNFLGRSEPLGADRVERTFKIVPEGFPVVGSKSDVLEGVAVHEIVLPETWVKGTLKLQAQVFPSTLADLQKGLEAMLREPCGCFEQSSSSNYPNVMILSYLKESDQANPELEKRARQLMQNGYGRLVSFECIDPQKAQTRRGYEWFGQTAPPHEALTAYGLLQFRDMAKVHPVDAAMLERTTKYLLSQRDGSGGFKRNARALDSFGRAPQNITNAYIVWALTEGGVQADLDLEMKTVLTEAKTSKDPYFVALVGISHLNRGKTAEALELFKALRGAQQADGRLTGAHMSITGSGGRDLEIETTALATLGWLRANRPGDFNDNVQKAARWIGQQRGGYGGFGSTQSTILALKALIAYTRASKTIAADADLVLSVNGKEVARKRFAAGSREELALAVNEDAGLKPGKNVIRVEMAKNNFPHTLTWSYRTLKPANPADCPVQLSTKLNRASATEGDTVRLTATVENKSGKGQGMAVAIIGLPGGLIVPEDMKQLKEMAALREEGTKPGLISAFEIRSRGRELVLYWRDLAPAQKITVNLDLVCRIPGEYRGPASRAYLYYNADRKFWTAPLAVTVAPRGE